jgi:hypothetical protein
MKLDNKRVKYSEALAIKVGRFLRGKKFTPANDRGMALENLWESSVMGVLCENPNIENYSKSMLFGLVKQIRPKKMFLGYLKFQENGTWKFIAYGNDNIEKIKILCEELSEKFDVAININLVSEKIHYEHKSSF